MRRVGRPAVDVFSMEKVVLQLRFRDKIGSLVIELREHTNCAGVGFLSGFSFPIELQHCHHALIPIVHKSSPSVKDRRPLSNNDGGGTGSKVRTVNCRAAAYLNMRLETDLRTRSLGSR